AWVAAGGRLWDYHDVAEELTPQEYVEQVVSGERRDRVLTPQLRAGFRFAGILPGYLEDWRSHDFASHLVWRNHAVTTSNRLSPATSAPRADRARHDVSTRRARSMSSD